MEEILILKDNEISKINSSIDRELLSVFIGIPSQYFISQEMKFNEMKPLIEDFLRSQDIIDLIPIIKWIDEKVIKK